MGVCCSSIFSQQTGTFTDTRDGKTYKTVKIGSQVWMAKNLAFKMDSGCWANDNNKSNLIKYGYLYNWEAAKKACPAGWHLPSKSEFDSLLNNYDDGDHGSYVALIPGGNSGFSALFGGCLSSNGVSLIVGVEAYFWSSSPSDAETVWNLFIGSTYSRAAVSYSSPLCSFSVRCLQNN